MEFDGATKSWWIEEAANADDFDGDTAEERRPGSRLATSDDWEDAIRSSEMARSQYSSTVYRTLWRGSLFDCQAPLTHPSSPAGMADQNEPPDSTVSI